MIIEITSSGGFAGLAPRVVKRVDLSTQPAEVREAMCDAFDPANLGAMERSARTEGAADMFTYHITITDPDRGVQNFDIREDQIPPEVLDLIDGM